MRFEIVLVLLVALVLASNAQMTVTFSPNQYAARTSRFTFQFEGDEEFQPKTLYQFGHSNQCQYLSNSADLPILFDPINKCFLTADIDSENPAQVGAITPSCEKFGDSEAKIAFSLTVSQTLPSKSSVTCVVNYVTDPMIGLREGDAILYRAVQEEAVKVSSSPCSASRLRADPVELKSTFPTFTQYTTEARFVSADPKTGIVKFTIVTPAPGLYKFNYNIALTTITSSDIYCTVATDDKKSIVGGRLWKNEKTNILFFHKKTLSLPSTAPLTCQAIFTPTNKLFQASTQLQLERGTPYESWFVFDNINGPLIASPTVLVVNAGQDTPPESGTISVPFWIPAGITTAASFWLDFDKVIKCRIEKTVPSLFFEKLQLLTKIPDGFEALELTGKDDKASNAIVGVKYVGKDALEAPLAIDLIYEYKEGTIPYQADISYTINYDGVSDEVVKKNEAWFRALYPLLKNQDKKKQVYFARAVLRNRITQYELTDNGWSLKVTSVVTAYLNTMDFTDANGWTTSFYLTDSYNTVQRDSQCRVTTDKKPDELDPEKWEIPVTHNEYGTLYVFSKAILKPLESLTIRCILPLKIQNLIGYLPAPEKRQLRIGVWSYDKTFDDGSNLYEDNHSHSVQPLRAIQKDAPHIQTAVFKFVADRHIISYDHIFVEHYTKVLAAMSTVLDRDTGKPLFRGELHSESVYGPLNYQFLNTTGASLAPYLSPADDITASNNAAGSSALAVPIYGDFSLAYLQGYVSELNTAIASLNTVIIDIVQDRAYIDSNGITTCGSPTARKCLLGAPRANGPECGGYSEPGPEGCTMSWPVYNPFVNAGTVATGMVATVVGALVAVLVAF